MMAPLPTTAHVHMTAKKTLYLANPYGFSAQQRGGPLHELVRALESMGADVWEPFARNNQIDRASAGWAYQIGQADLRDVRAADGLFAVVNGCPPDEGVMVELGLAIDLVTGPTSLAGAVYPQVSVDRGSLRDVVCMLKVFEPRPARFHSASHSRIFEIRCAQPRLRIPKRSPTSSD